MRYAALVLHGSLTAVGIAAFVVVLVIAVGFLIVSWCQMRSGAVFESEMGHRLIRMRFSSAGSREASGLLPRSPDLSYDPVPEPVAAERRDEPTSADPIAHDT